MQEYPPLSSYLPKTEHGGTDLVWFYDMTADGFSLDDKRTPIAENDITDIIERDLRIWIRKQKENVRINHLWCRNRILLKMAMTSVLINTKKLSMFQSEYPPTSEIMASIREIELEIGKEMDELEKLLNL